MPIGPYKDFSACLRSQTSKGKSPEAARRICGALQRDLEKKSIDLQYDFLKSVINSSEKTENSNVG